MSNEQHLIENALVEYCQYLKENNLDKDFHFSDFVKESAKECGVNINTLYEMCIYIVFDYGREIQDEVTYYVDKSAGYNVVDYDDIPHFYARYCCDED